MRFENAYTYMSLSPNILMDQVDTSHVGRYGLEI